MATVTNLLVNGLATGMLVFLLAAGLTLIFGLMDVLILDMADCLLGGLIPVFGYSLARAALYWLSSVRSSPALCLAS